jgi:heavy metal sensor kinase
LTPALVERFSNAPPAGSYFAIWSATGDLLRSTAPDPASIPAPAPRADPYPFARGPQGPEAPIIRQRGDAREAYTYGPFGARILVGKSIQPERAELHRLAALLSGAGAAVLLIGLIGGWMLSLGVVRPIAEITAAAQSISASNLSRRIDVAGTQSELGNLAAVLNDTFARLEAAFQQQIRFTADASHELRTPLAIIHSHSQLALSRPRSAEEYQTMFQTCLRASDRMKNLVDSLLLLARADGGRLNLTLAPVDLRRIAEDAIDLLTPLAAARSITIEKKLQAAVLTADATRLAQVAANLLSNAIRYNRDGGKVEVTVSEDATDAILTISDTGLGIAPENQTHLFERFYRVDEARSRAEGGSGLGLSICKTIVQAHGGAITFQSEVNKGTTFTVRLSRAPGGLQGSRTED